MQHISEPIGKVMDNIKANISLHEEYMQAAFDSVLQAEQELIEIEGRLSKAVALLKTDKAIAEQKVSKAWGAVNALMQETGEAEVLLPAGNGTFNKIYYTSPRQSLKVDEDAVPDEFVKIERKPKLLEIKEHLKGQEKLPNWAHFENSIPRLAWKSIKRKGDDNE